MKHYARLDLTMETTQVCIVDENGRKLVSEKVESTPEAIAMIARTIPFDQAGSDRNRAHVAGHLPWPARTGRRASVYRCPAGHTRASKR